MTSRAIKTSPTEKSRYPVFLRRSKACVEGAESELDNSRWASAGILAVQGAIAAADALCVFELGKRASGGSHQDAAMLLGGIAEPVIREKMTAFRRIISLKNKAEYEDHELREPEARSLTVLTFRFYKWVHEHIQGSVKE